MPRPTEPIPTQLALPIEFTNFEDTVYLGSSPEDAEDDPIDLIAIGREFGQVALWGGAELHVPNRAERLLRLTASQPNVPVTLDVIGQNLGLDVTSRQGIDTIRHHVLILRSRLDARRSLDSEAYIATAHGFGYMAVQSALAKQYSSDRPLAAMPDIVRAENWPVPIAECRPVTTWIRMDAESATFYIGGQLVMFGPQISRLAVKLCSSPDTILTSAELLAALKGDNAPEVITIQHRRQLSAAVSSLREVMEPHGVDIVGVRGTGYMFSAQPTYRRR